MRAVTDGVEFPTYYDSRKDPREVRLELQGKRVVQCKRYYHTFQGWTDWLAFYAYQDSLPQHLRNFYESIPEGHQKMRYDIDINVKAFSGYTYAQLLQFGEELKDRVIYLNFIAMGLENAGMDWSTYLHRHIAPCTSHGPTKVSYHIIIHGLHVESSKHAKYIALQVYDGLSAKERACLDRGVYGSFQQFRILGSHKWEYPSADMSPPRPKIFQRKWMFSGKQIEHVPQWPGPEGEFLESLITHIDINTSKLVYMDLPATHPRYPRQHKMTSDGRIDSCIKFDVDKALALLGSLKCNFVVREVRAKLNGGLILLDRIGKTMCPSCNEEHEHESPYIVVTDDHAVLWNCRRTDKDVFAHMGMMVRPDLTRMLDPTKLPPSQVYEADKVRDFNAAQNGCYLVGSAMATGKTTALMKLLKSGKYETALCLSPRQLFGDDFFKTTKDNNLGFVLYSVTLRGERLIIQMESLYKLLDLIEQGLKYDIMIIDESESCIKQFSSPTMARLKECARVFEHLVKHTPVVIACDAFLSSKTQKCLERIRGEPAHVEINLKKQIKRWAWRFWNGDHMLSYIETFILNGTRAGMVFASKKKMLEFCERLRQKNPKLVIKCYYDKTDDATRADLKDVRNAWKDADVVCFTPSITVGVNFDVPGHFQFLGVYATKNSCCARDIFQMMMRIRDIASGHVYYYLWCRTSKKDKEHLPITKSAIRQQLADNVLFLDKHISAHNLNGEGWEHMPMWLREAHIANIKEDNTSRVYYEAVFKAYLEQCNYVDMGVVYPPKEESRTRADIIQSADSSGSYDKINSITFELYQEIKYKINKRMATESEKWEADKYVFDGLLSADCLDSTIRGSLYDKYWYRRKRTPGSPNIIDNLINEKAADTDGQYRAEMTIEYKENWSLTSKRERAIADICGAIGIQNSSVDKTWTHEEFMKGVPLLERDAEFTKLFSLDYTVDKTDKKLHLVHMLSAIFKAWSGTRVAMDWKHRHRIKDEDFTPVIKKGGTNKEKNGAADLWNALKARHK